MPMFQEQWQLLKAIFLTILPLPPPWLPFLQKKLMCDVYQFKYVAEV
jgi:hypothetical protein